ncbi:MAG: Bug family tripartite tricarboxylate transporter substrate binding protein [Xanthobacteraceae bacterium]
MLKAGAHFVGLLLIGLCGLGSPAQAQDFYKGKTLTIVVGFSPAGGYDSYARVLAHHIGDHIPGKPTIIVQNMPGAGSLTSVRYLDLTAPKDGTVMTIFNPGLVTQSIVQPDRVRLDFRKFSWVGVVTPDFRVCYGYGPNGIKSWGQLIHGGKQFIIGSTGKGSGNYINGATLRILFHAPVKQVLGFPGSAEQRLAIEQGELDGDCGSYSSIPIDWINKGFVHAFVRFIQKKPPEIPDSAVFIGTFATSDAQRQLLRVLDGGDEVGRPFIMSKQVPADRLAILRKAFDDTMKDSAFLADMAKEQLPVHPITGQEAEKIVGELTSVPANIVAQAKPIYQ